MSEIVFASSVAQESRRISRRVKKGELRALVPRVYTSNLVDPLEKIVRRNLVSLLGALYRGALLSHRSALEGGGLQGDDLFLTYTSTRKVTWPGVTLHLLAGPEPQEGDLPHLGQLRLVSRARALLENMQPSRGPVKKTLPQAAVEQLLEKIYRIHGEAELNRLRDEAHVLAERLGMVREFSTLNHLFASYLGTGDDQSLLTRPARALAAKTPFDEDRVELLTRLVGALNAEVLPRIAEPSLTSDGWIHRAFFESYFSNFIEGTEFEVTEAREIVFERKVPVQRPQDAHDIVGTFELVSDRFETRQIPDSPDEFLALLQSRHCKLLAARPEVEPGKFKENPNRAGSTQFVQPHLVRGTLRVGFELGQSLTDGFARALYAMFLIAEVHPFKDGNGRLARVFLNAELTNARLSRIIVPEVFRDDYVQALKALTNCGNADPYIRAMSKAQQFTALVNYETFDACLLDLTRRNAFRDPNEARLGWQA